VDVTTTTTHLACMDGNGNVTTLVNAATKQPTARYEYSPFGDLTRQTGPYAAQNPYRFSTKPQDPTTALLYYGYRWLKPDWNTWTSRDPIEENGGMNLYGFVGNDGVNWVDLLGLADINVEIIRQYLEWETIGTFTATPTDEKVKKCCGSVTGQTLELKKGNYEVADGRGNKNYPIYEGERDGFYSPSSNTSINGQQRWLNKNYPNSNGSQRALVPGTIGENNINVISNNPKRLGQSSFGGTRMHHGQSSQSSEGCPIVGCNMKKGEITNSRYSDIEKGKKFPGHYFDKKDSIAKAIELNTLVECVQKSLKRRPTIKVNIRIK
jgi:RHS repeat-associated protein